MKQENKMLATLTHADVMMAINKWVFDSLGMPIRPIETTLAIGSSASREVTASVLFEQVDTRWRWHPSDPEFRDVRECSKTVDGLQVRLQSWHNGSSFQWYVSTDHHPRSHQGGAMMFDDALEAAMTMVAFELRKAKT